MYVNRAQKFFSCVGYYANWFSRISACHVERITRPMPQKDRDAYWIEVEERVKRTCLAIFLILLAAVLFIPAFTCYSLAACVGIGRFESIKPESSANFWSKRSVKVMSFNACFQDIWAPLTAGVVPPFEPVGDCLSRVAAVVNAIVQENPVVYMGQEFDSLRAQDECIRLM